jgi:hypothetical protein
MINKSIISAISFLLISTFYVASASAGVNATTRLFVDVPWGCGVITPMTNWHCPLTSSEGSTNYSGHDTLAFDCTGGDNGRSVTSVMTKNCGRLTMTTFMNDVSGGNYAGIEHFADLSHGNGVCKTCKRQPVTTKKLGWAYFYIKIKTPVGGEGRSRVSEGNLIYN